MHNSETDTDNGELQTWYEIPYFIALNDEERIQSTSSWSLACGSYKQNDDKSHHQHQGKYEDWENKNVNSS